MATDPLAGCTRRQRMVFEQIAGGNDRGHSEGMLRALLQRGLIEKVGTEVISHGPVGPVTITRFAVPVEIHMAWCAWRDASVDDG